MFSWAILSIAVTTRLRLSSCCSAIKRDILSALRFSEEITNVVKLLTSTVSTMNVFASMDQPTLGNIALKSSIISRSLPSLTGECSQFTAVYHREFQLSIKFDCLNEIKKFLTKVNLKIFFLLTTEDRNFLTFSNFIEFSLFQVHFVISCGATPRRLKIGPFHNAAPVGSLVRKLLLSSITSTVSN